MITLELFYILVAAIPSFVIKLFVYWGTIKANYQYLRCVTPSPVEVVDGRIGQDCRCADCGYSLKTLTGSGLCPECGNPYDVLVAPARPRIEFSAISAALSICFFDIALSIILLAFIHWNSGWLLVGLGASKVIVWSSAYAWYSVYFQRGGKTVLSFIGLGLVAAIVTDAIGAAVLSVLISTAPKC